MSSLKGLLTSSTGRKYVMSLTGLFLCVFLVEHLYSNLPLFYGDGGVAFNQGSHDMVHNVFIRIVEVVLFISIVVHVIQALTLTRQNANARPVKYAVSKASENSSWYSRNMGLTGSVILFFIVVHLANFFVPYRITDHLAEEGETLSQEVVEALTNPAYAALYLVSVIILACHLNHGFQSGFQSLGLNNKKYASSLKIAGTIFAIVMGIGYAAFPIAFMIGGEDFINWNLH